MPLYELFCLVKPGLGKQVGDIMKLAGKTVIDRGGVLTDLKFFGEQPLAYLVRRPGEKYEKAAFWQLTFAAKPQTLPEIDHHLKVDERVLRWTVLKQRHLEALPSSYKIARAAEKVEDPLQNQNGKSLSQGTLEVEK